jgi:hypothetical protein
MALSVVLEPLHITDGLAEAEIVGIGTTVTCKVRCPAQPNAFNAFTV